MGQCSSHAPAGRLAHQIDRDVRNASSDSMSWKRTKSLERLASRSLERGLSDIMLDTKGVVEAMMGAAKCDESCEVREKGLKGLANLACAPENKVCLFETDGVVETLLHAAENGQTAAEREVALRGLATLAYAPENAKRLFLTENVVNIMVRGAQCEDSLLVKEQGLRGLANLAYSADKIGLFKTEGVVDALVEAASKGGRSNNAIKEQGLWGLANLAYEPEIRLGLFEKDGVMQALATSAKTGPTDSIREAALNGLCNLARAPEIRLQIYETNDVLDSMVHGAEFGNTHGVRQAGQWGIWILSESIPVAESLGENDLFISWLDRVNFEDDFALSAVYFHLAMAPRSRVKLRGNVDALFQIEALGHVDRSKVSRCFSKLALAILLGSVGGDHNHICTEEETFRVILAILDAALRGRPLFGNAWPLNQPLLALRFLSTLDTNRQMLGTTWLCTLTNAVSKAIIQDDASTAESVFACITHYALDQEMSPVLREHAGAYIACAERVMQEKAADDNWRMATKLAFGLMFILRSVNNEENVAKSSPKSNQVMISYPCGHTLHNVREIVADIEGFVQECGFSVWHEDKSTGSSVEGVAQSSVVIALLSKEYMESANCRRDLTHAVECGKRILPIVIEPEYDHRFDGWLGLAIGNLLYFDTAGLPKEQRDTILRSLVKSELEGNHHLVAEALPESCCPSKSQRCFKFKTEEDIICWTKDVKLPNDVAQALIKQGYTNDKLLESLVDEPTPDLLRLLQLDMAAHASMLRVELKKAFAM